MGTVPLGRLSIVDGFEIYIQDGKIIISEIPLRLAPIIGYIQFPYTFNTAVCIGSLSKTAGARALGRYQRRGRGSVM